MRDPGGWWADVPGFPGYRISRAAELVKVYKNGRELWLKPDVDGRGRQRYTLSLKGKVHRRFVGAWVLLAFVGPGRPGEEVAHGDGDHTNNWLYNVRWDNHSANLLDKRGHGTMPRGEGIRQSKLTEGKVRDIRTYYACGMTFKEIAREFRVHPTTVARIVRRERWKHVA